MRFIFWFLGIFIGAFLLVGFIRPDWLPIQTTLEKSQFSLFSSDKNDHCEEYQSSLWKLNDRVRDYLEPSYLNGIGVLKSTREVQHKLDSGQLIQVYPNDLFQLDTFRYSYACLTPGALELLNDIGIRFQEKLTHTDLKETKLLVTSMLRTENTVKRLRKKNRNAIRHSAHLHGTTFDITYAQFVSQKELSEGERDYLKEILAQVLLELRTEDRCWVTYEVWQTCFHIVHRC